MAAFHAKPERLRDAPGAEKRRDPKDRYETPDEVTDALLRARYNFGGPIPEVWEPACGTGRIVRRLQDHGFSVSSSDIEEDGVDFLRATERWSGDLVTNPPFSLARQFVERAMELVDGRIHLLLPMDFLHSINRRDWLHGPARPSHVLLVPWRIKFFKRDGSTIPGQAYSHAWVTWPERGERDFQIETLLEWAELPEHMARRVASKTGLYRGPRRTQMWGGYNRKKGSG